MWHKSTMLLVHEFQKDILVCFRAIFQGSRCSIDEETFNRVESFSTKTLVRFKRSKSTLKKKHWNDNYYFFLRRPSTFHVRYWFPYWKTILWLNRGNDAWGMSEGFYGRAGRTLPINSARLTSKGPKTYETIYIRTPTPELFIPIAAHMNREWSIVIVQND